jgi:carbamoyl-phosphate synthase large subunit
MVSDRDAVEITHDKLQFFQTTSRMGFSSIITSENIDDISAEMFVVKERFGAGSRQIGLRLTHDLALKQSKHLNNPIFQPYIDGIELSIDLYLDIKGKGKGSIVRTRDLVISGESQITTIITKDELSEMMISLAEELGLYGHVMFQVIHDMEEDLYHILECNPRFGGASTLSLEMGLDSFHWFFLEVLGHDLDFHPFKRFSGERRMIRYPEDLILP